MPRWPKPQGRSGKIITINFDEVVYAAVKVEAEKRQLPFQTALAVICREWFADRGHVLPGSSIRKMGRPNRSGRPPRKPATTDAQG